MYENLKMALKVDSRNQLKDSDCVIFENLENNGTRVLFVGNSITLHGIADNIGWHGFWGMAASEKSKDYVHLVEDYIREKDSESAFCICNAADWERQYKNGMGTFPLYQNARDFEADIMIIKLSANCPQKKFDLSAFKNSFASLIRYLNKSGNAKIIVVTEFYRHPAEEAIIGYAKEHNFPYCVLSDLEDKDEMKAIGLFEHSGVANHPGDLGMKYIADRIISVLENSLLFG